MKRVYTDEEICYCESKRMCRFQSYAARFAAKEAAYKAISPDFADGIRWQDIEVINKKNGKPVVRFYGKFKEYVERKGVMADCVDVSLSHDDSFAVATVVIVHD